MTRNARTRQVVVSSLYEGTMSRQVAAVELGADLGVYVQRLRNDRSDGNAASGVEERTLLPDDRIAVSADRSIAFVSRRNRDGGLDVSRGVGGGSFSLGFDADLRVASSGDRLLALTTTRVAGRQNCERGDVQVFLIDGTGSPLRATGTVADFRDALIAPDGGSFVVHRSSTTTLYRESGGQQLAPRAIGVAGQVWFSDTGQQLFLKRRSALSSMDVGSPQQGFRSMEASLRSGRVLDHATRLSDGAEAMVQANQVTVWRAGSGQNPTWAARVPDGYEFRSVAFDVSGDVLAGTIEVESDGGPFLGAGRVPNDQRRVELRIVGYSGAFGDRKPNRSIPIADVPWWNAVAPEIRYDVRDGSGWRPGIVVQGWPSAWRVEL